jgi:hypothetical protein
MLFALCQIASAWEHHPLITEPIISTMPQVVGAASVSATSLETFLAAVEPDLAAFLNNEETWARENMSNYKPRPDALAFTASGDLTNIRDRFLKAIRVNPLIKTPLYTSSLAGTKLGAQKTLTPSEVSILSELSVLSDFDFESIAEGESAAPIDVVATASNEPDYGLDIGLFEDNNTTFGQYYGFGVQPFGNPALDFGSQAPFHMGLYHESKIIYFFASFLKESYPEYRIHLFKSLSEFAFAHGQDYWGWRFMGWGLHYLSDLSMPYHTTALPGYSALRMLFVNILDMIGWSTPKDNAVQLSSNRHVALEAFQSSLLKNATLTNNLTDLTLSRLLEVGDIPTYTDNVPREKISKKSHALSCKMDKTIEQLMPSYYVSDPTFELGNDENRYELVDMVYANGGQDAVDDLNDLVADTVSSFASYGRGYVLAILNAS